MMRQTLIKKLVGDVSTFSTIPPHHKLESIFFNISYGNVPLKFNKPEVNEKNETAKQPSLPASPVKTDKSTQAKCINMICPSSKN